VRVSPDMGIAKVYLSLFPVKDKKAAIAHIKEHSHRLRGQLGLRVGQADAGRTRTAVLHR
jgi:ribosome-binding factor A